jgi:hypothetical protein
VRCLIASKSPIVDKGYHMLSRLAPSCGVIVEIVARSRPVLVPSDPLSNVLLAWSRGFRRGSTIAFYRLRTLEARKHSQWLDLLRDRRGAATPLRFFL